MGARLDAQKVERLDDSDKTQWISVDVIGWYKDDTHKRDAYIMRYHNIGRCVFTYYADYGEDYKDVLDIVKAMAATYRRINGERNNGNN